MEDKELEETTRVPVTESFLEHELVETEKINVVPLADLALVLLIILMVISPIIMQSMIKVQTPKSVKAEAPKGTAQEGPLLIDIRPTGLLLNNQPLGSDFELAVQLRLKLSASPERPVVVSADSAIRVGRVVRVLDLAKQTGALKVSLLKKAEAT